MMRLALDENVNNDILRGLRRLYPDVDIVRVQDTEVYEADDPLVLEWAAKEERILLTHDVNTMTKFAYDRIKEGLSMPGVLAISGTAPIGKIIDELAVIIGASQADEWAEKVTFIPFS